jgi:hypothetical protein
MNRQISTISIILAILLMLSASASAATIPEAIIKGADRLVSTQNIDGSWEWLNPDLDPATTIYPAQNNVPGVTARGLVSAYKVTKNVSYINAAKKTAGIMLVRAPGEPGYTDNATHHRVYAQDIIFLTEFARAYARSGNPDAASVSSAASAKALEYMHFILEQPNRQCANGCNGNASVLVNRNFNLRQPNLYGWDIEAWVEAAVVTGHDDFAHQIVNEMNPYYSSISKTGTGEYYVLGLSGYAQSNALTLGVNNTMVASLLAERNANNSFKIYNPVDDGILQTTAYATLALFASDIDSYRDSAKYLASVQESNGGWIDGVECTEVNAEIITALSKAKEDDNEKETSDDHNNKDEQHKDEHKNKNDEHKNKK